MEDYVPPLKPKKCCVPQCLNRHGRRHRFPKRDPAIFDQWIQIIKPENCDKLTKEQMYHRYYVCDEHFSSESFLPGTQRGLMRNAVPTLNVPDSENYPEIPQPGCSFININNTEASCSSAEISAKSLGPEQSLTKSPESSNFTTRTPRGIRRRTSILGQVNVTRSLQLTPKAKGFYTTLKGWSVLVNINN